MTPPATPGNQPDPAARLTEALRARAVAGASHPPNGGPDGYRPGPHRVGSRRDPEQALRRQIIAALAIALIAGVVLGVAIGVVSLAAPGVLPALG